MGMFDIGNSIPPIPPAHRRTVPLSEQDRRQPRHRQPPRQPPRPAQGNDPEDGLPHVDDYA
jgi:hypothetical protein